MSEITVVIIKPRIGNPGVPPYATMGIFLNYLEIHCPDIKIDHVSMFNVVGDDIEAIHGFTRNNDPINRYKQMAKLYESAPTIFIALKGNNAIARIRYMVLSVVRPAIVKDKEISIENYVLDNGVHAADSLGEFQRNVKGAVMIAHRDDDINSLRYWAHLIVGDFLIEDELLRLANAKLIPNY